MVMNLLTSGYDFAGLMESVAGFFTNINALHIIEMNTIARPLLARQSAAECSSAYSFICESRDCTLANSSSESRK